MSELQAVQIRCQKCPATITREGTVSREAILAALEHAGWVIGKVTLCPACREGGGGMSIPVMNKIARGEFTL